MKLAQLRMWFRMIKSPPVNRNRKQELWERDLSAMSKFKINARQKWRRFDTQTRGMGFIFVLLFGVILLVNLIPLIAHQWIRQIETAPYKDALNTACLNQDFYNLNFKSCETIGVRP